MILSFKHKSIRWSFLVLSIGLMVGCSKATTPPKDTTNTQNQNEVPEASTSTPATEDNSASNTNDNQSSTSTNAYDSQKKVLSNILKLANQGRIINCEFPVNTTIIEDVEKSWGKPDNTDWVAEAKGTYSTFSKKNVVFGFNKGSQIFEVRSLQKDLNKISLSMVKDFFGTPAYDVKTTSEEIIGYTAGTDYKILFVFPKSLKSGGSQFLNHYSVLYPKGTVNNMADDPGRQW